MNENTAKLIEQLAQKLGTTSEYLWSVLLRQAPIDATVTLIQFLVVILYGFVLWKIHKRLMKEVKTGSYSTTGYGEYEELAIIPMGILAIIFIILIIAAFSNIDNIIIGYVNPEYWALKQVLGSVK